MLQLIGKQVVDQLQVAIIIIPSIVKINEDNVSKKCLHNIWVNAQEIRGGIRREGKGRGEKGRGGKGREGKGGEGKGKDSSLRNTRSRD